jgi:hypothetical protein
MNQLPGFCNRFLSIGLKSRPGEQAGLTQREAAGVIGLKAGAAVSIQLRRLQQARPQEADLARQVSLIESQLNNLLFKR